MIALPASLTLGNSDLQQLQQLQQLIDNANGYPAKVTLADQKWVAKSSSLFARVRSALELECPGARRCIYCEDSLADEIEHIRPKNWFPEQTFVPDNYLFACGPCNGPKSNDFATVDSFGQLSESKRTKHGAISPPPSGQEALLHPRFDLSSDYLFLDIVNTFEFKPHHTLDNQQEARAIYTIKTLRMNKDPLQQARREAFKDFAGRLKSYYLAKINNESNFHLNQIRNELLQKQHITVWREMQRQIVFLPFLKELFDLVPGAEHW